MTSRPRVSAGSVVRHGSPAGAQERAVTLAEAIRLSERVQPGVVQARGNVETAAAQRRNAWGAYLPSVSAGSSASEFFTEAPRGSIRSPGRSSPATPPTAASSTRSRPAWTSSPDSAAVPRPRRPGPGRRRRSVAGGRPLPAGADHHQPVLQRARRGPAGQGPRGKRAARRGAAQGVGQQAAGRLGHALRHAAVAGHPGQRQPRPDPGRGRSRHRRSRAGAAGGRGRPGRRPRTTPHSTGSCRRSTPLRSAPRPSAIAAGTERRGQGRCRPGRALAPPSRPTGPASTCRRAPPGTPAGPTTTICSTSGSSASGCGGTCSTASTGSWRRAAVGRPRPGRRHRGGREAAVASELTAALAQLDAARIQIDITQTSVVAATEDLRVQQERYRLGASTIVDVLTSQEALNQAEVDVVVARFDYLRAKAQIEALIGRTL